jgi:hypothetical protein
MTERTLVSLSFLNIKPLAESMNNFEKSAQPAC